MTKFYKKVTNADVVAAVSKVVAFDDKKYVELLNVNCQVMTFKDAAMTEPKAVKLSMDKDSWVPFWALAVDMDNNLYLHCKVADEKYSERQREL